MITVYFDRNGYVYAAHEPDGYDHQERGEFGSYDDARRFVRQEFTVLIANSREWIVVEGHPAAPEDDE